MSAAGASALLLTGCLGGAKGEDFVGFWAQERTHNGVTQVIGVSRIERVSANAVSYTHLTLPTKRIV